MQILAELEAYLSQADVREVYVNGNLGLGVLGPSHHELLPLPEFFRDKEAFILACQNFALHQGLRLDPLRPFAGGILNKKSWRWHCIIPPAAPQGPIFTLRKHLFGDLTIDDFDGDKAHIMKIKSLMKQGASLLFCGETGSGKTSLLTACLQTVALMERVLIVEELEEIPLLGGLWSRLLCKPLNVHGAGELSMESLFRECLRLRPDRMVMGELRGKDFFCFLEAVSSGQKGVLASYHARTPEQLNQRLLNSSFRPSSLGSLNVHGVFLQRNNPCRVTAVEKLPNLISAEKIDG